MNPPTDPPPLDLLLLVPPAAALLLRALALAGETAVGAVGTERAEELAKEKSGGRTLLRLKQDSEHLAAAVRSLMSLALAVMAATLALTAVDLSAASWPGLDAWVAASAGALAAWVLTTPAEMLMRSLASARPEPWALRLAPLLLAIRAIFAPIARAVGGALDLVLKPAGVTVRFSAPPPPLEEIERFLTDNREEGAPEPELVQRLFEFGEQTVKEIMVPRTDVFAIPYEAAADEVVRLFVEEGHTRVPVYRETLDKVVGIVHVKDVLPLIANPELIILHDLMRPPMFVPWNRPIPKVMRELQRKGQHLAVVVDEYGGVAGIVTLEDIVEQIVGDIRDEFDEEEEAEVTSAGDGASIVRADMRVVDFNEEFDAGLPEEGGFETLGGFLNTLAGAIPGEGDRFYHAGFEFQVTRREPRRVIEVKVTRTRSDAAQAEGRA